MALETGTYISDLVATNPTAADAKSQGDDHLRLLKTVLKTTFPAFGGIMPVAHDQVASKDYVNQTAFSSALPAQTGNSGKALFTDGTAASWQQVFPAQSGNSGRFLTTDGATTSWSNSLRTNVFRLADGTDATKLAAFVLSGIPTGTTRSYTLPPAGGTLALLSDVAALFPTITVREERPSGTGGGTNVAGAQVRVFNVVAKNNIPGASLSSNQINLPAGTYKVEGDAPAVGMTRHKAYLVDVVSGASLLVGTSESGQAGPARSVIRGEIVLATARAVTVTHWMSAVGGTDALGYWVAAPGLVEVYSQITFEKTA